MATETTERIGTSKLNSIWIGSIAAGLGGGVLMGLVLQFVIGNISAVGALYTVNTTVAGWGFHLLHSAVFGLAFGALVTSKAYRRRATDFGSVLFTGIAWALLLWIVAASIVMPLWLGGVGAGAPDSIPAIDLRSGVGHLVYGATLGAVVGALNVR